jgi:hypothetical protein
MKTHPVTHIALLCTLASPLLAIDQHYFSTTVYPTLQKAGCQGCHNPDGVAAGTRLHFPDPGAPEKSLDNFGLSLQTFVDRADPAKSLLLNKPTRRIAHAGGKRIAPGSPEETVLRNWVDFLATTSAVARKEAETVAPQVGPVLRRLTHTQYNNTIRDLLADESNLADQFPPEDFVNGFKNQYQSQSVSPLLAEAYSIAAEKLAQNAFRGGDTKNLIPCKQADAGCPEKFVRSFGQKAFRRPLLKDEVDRYARLFRSQKAFLAGAQIVVEGMLQSPGFLLRTDAAQSKAYERASRLSYFLWNTMPDAALFRSAAAGELDTPEGLETVARRMLKDPKAHQSVDDFLAQWMRFDRLLNTIKDRRSFPQYGPELALAMTEEARRLVSDLVWNNGDFTKIYSADYAFLNSGLATLYKVPAPPDDFGKVTLPPDTERAGIIGQALFLALTSKPADTSPTARGLFIREQFLCQDVPQPPPGVSTNLPPLMKEKPQTNRERLGVHLNNESCASCHTLIDPIGFGLEKFDAIGQRREKVKLTFRGGKHGNSEEDMETVELPLDTSGYIAGIRNSEFSTPRALGSVLAASPQCQECIAKQLFRYESGRKESPADRPIIHQSFDDFRKSGFRFQELMISLIKSSIFEPRRSESNGVSGN